MRLILWNWLPDSTSSTKTGPLCYFCPPPRLLPRQQARRFTQMCLFWGARWLAGFSQQILVPRSLRISALFGAWDLLQGEPKGAKEDLYSERICVNTYVGASCLCAVMPLCFSSENQYIYIRISRYVQPCILPMLGVKSFCLLPPCLALD